MILESANGPNEQSSIFKLEICFLFIFLYFKFDKRDLRGLQYSYVCNILISRKFTSIRRQAKMVELLSTSLAESFHLHPSRGLMASSTWFLRRFTGLTWSNLGMRKLTSPMQKSWQMRKYWHFPSQSSTVVLQLISHVMKRSSSNFFWPQFLFNAYKMVNLK